MLEATEAIKEEEEGGEKNDGDGIMQVERTLMVRFG